MSTRRTISVRSLFLLTTYVATFIMLVTEGNRVDSSLWGLGHLLAAVFICILVFVHYPGITGKPSRERLIVLSIGILIAIGILLLVPSIR
jgi:predicted ferric reductase